MYSYYTKYKYAVIALMLFAIFSFVPVNTMANQTSPGKTTSVSTNSRNGDLAWYGGHRHSRYYNYYPYYRSYSYYPYYSGYSYYNYPYSSSYYYDNYYPYGYYYSYPSSYYYSYPYRSGVYFRFGR